MRLTDDDSFDSVKFTLDPATPTAGGGGAAAQPAGGGRPLQRQAARLGAADLFITTSVAAPLGPNRTSVCCSKAVMNEKGHCVCTRPVRTQQDRHTSERCGCLAPVLWSFQLPASPPTSGKGVGGCCGCAAASRRRRFLPTKQTKTTNDSMLSEARQVIWSFQMSPLLRQRGGALLEATIAAVDACVARLSPNSATMLMRDYQLLKLEDSHPECVVKYKKNSKYKIFTTSHLLREFHVMECLCVRVTP